MELSGPMIISQRSLMDDIHSSGNGWVNITLLSFCICSQFFIIMNISLIFVPVEPVISRSPRVLKKS
jgi:hypothetical protein